MISGRVLIVGGGVAGMSCAIMLRRLGVEVDLVDLDPEWRVYGAGITITGPTLRAFETIGILDEVMREGFTGEGLDVRGVEGDIRSTVRTPVYGLTTLPSAGGIMRPKLHRILSERVRAAGVNVVLGHTVEDFSEDAEGLDVVLTNGERGRYSLMVGADGVASALRKRLFPHAPGPEYTGQICWRVKLPRDPEIENRCHFLGGAVKVGLTPVSPDEMYMFLVENEPNWRRKDPEQLHVELRRLMEGFGGVLARVRESLSAESGIIYRPLESFLLPRPWYKGRVVLIGDAAHPTTPHLASGAGLSVEDAIVLSEALEQEDDLPTALERFMERRWERCRMVVENSIEVGRRERAGRPPEDQVGLVEQSLRKLAEPI